MKMEKTSANELTVPVNERVILSMKSKDVLHSFFCTKFLELNKMWFPGYITKLSFCSNKSWKVQNFFVPSIVVQHTRQ